MLKIHGNILKEGSFLIKLKDIELYVGVSWRDGAYIISPRLKVISGFPVFIKDVKIGELDYDGMLLVNNFQSWGPCKFLHPKSYMSYIDNVKLPEEFFVTPAPEDIRKCIVSDYFLATENFFLGFLSSRVVHPYFMWRDGLLKVKVYIGRRVSPSEEIVMDKLWVREFDSIEDALKEYAMFVAKENSVRIGRAIYGWASWYHYYLDISQKYLLEELRLAEELGMGYKLFQIDDGYEKDIGDWLDTNAKFPEGLRFMAKKIKESGMTPGIWLAPFSVSATSDLFRNHPDWVVKDGSGNPKIAYRNWNKDIYALDTTHPDALDWLKSVFIELKEYGYDFFKIDFLFAAMLSGVRYKNVTPVESYRMGIYTIREAAKDSHLLGCGAPLLPSVGYVDSMRVGPDTSIRWYADDIGLPSAKHSLRNALMRHFMSLWWRNDPDCVMVRSKETELSENERFLNVYLPSILNTHVLESDKLSVLGKKDICLLKASLGFRGGESVAKLIDSERFVVVSENGMNGDLLAFVNLSDEIWNVRFREISRHVNRVGTFLVLYPEFSILREDIEVAPHAITIVLCRRERNIKVEHEKKPDGRMFHYYHGSERR